MSKTLPQEFTNRMKTYLGDDYAAFISSYDKEAVKGLRLNPLKADTINIFPDLPRVLWCKTGYYYDGEMRPGKHPYHAAGVYYIQEPSAMLPGELACKAIRKVIDDKGYVRVLDMCAAPGGKATHMAGEIGDKGILVANEPVPSRARALSQNIERLGIRNCLVTVENPEKLAECFAGFFDVVLTDVPCSGEGMFRRDDIAVEEWSAENVDNCILRGRTITDAAHICLKPGGYLIYSTCTFEPGEDEDAIRLFLNGHPSYSVADIAIDGFSPDNGMYRIWPHKHEGEGHFAAVLKSDGSPCGGENELPGKISQTVRFLPGTDRKTQEILTEGLKGILTDEGSEQILAGEIFAYGDNLYVAYDEIAEAATGRRKGTRLRIERAGLHLGEVHKGIFKPSHSLALALKPHMCRQIVPLDAKDERTYRYLRGESIACEPDLKGYCVVTVDGYTLGFGKATGGMLKNHYPKGLRWSP